MTEEILIVDDEPDIRALISLSLEDEGFATVQAADGAAARDVLSSRQPSAAILDIWMRESDMDGLELLNWCRSIYPEMPVIMISGHGTIATAVQAIRQGAYDFVEKPFKTERLLLTVRRALQTRRLEQENAALRSQTGQTEAPRLIGQSAAIRQLGQQVEKLAPTASRVLISGPSGSGKETLARVIHAQSGRGEQPFVVAACGRLTAERADAELFGSEQLQAGRRVVGLLEQANRGTLYFDEICDLPPETQGRIVRAVAEQRFRRIGGASEVVADVRIISASSRDIPAAIADGSLREDLFYRLGVVQLEIPPLSRRREDISLLAKHFAAHQCQILGRPLVKLGEDLLNAMRACSWPGQVRQLRNALESMIILAPNEADIVLGASALPAQLLADNTGGQSAVTAEEMLSLPLRQAREAFEKEYMTAQLDRFAGHISQMAKFVGMERSALHRKLKALGVQAADEDKDQ
jgi:two-component system nitrogen regulation response regulator NtrX